MKLLLEKPDCDVLGKDFSFGDQRTPLHKSAVGGRYLATQLLILELRSRGLLGEALRIRDSSGKTPLEVAEEILPHEEGERKSVARWDAVAGAKADWSKCAALLRSAEEAGNVPGSSKKESARLPLPPPHLSNVNTCLDCDAQSGNGQCLTLSWQNAFQAALGSSLDSSLSMEPRNSSQHLSDNHRPTDDSSLPVLDPSNPAPTTVQEIIETSKTGGIACQQCKKETISVYPLANGLLVAGRVDERPDDVTSRIL
eukprot:CAMPEP_0176122882 /NCGR_PEP_ID=MMETSP0120_2-20121206/61898_1 /TAXON_ID=160619 /ORGANISM="Kryptoperidinium foliaceum, Strain CCMP 1326" /LENGTH=254 /DNA_ID=CAMNT_0017457529 /DNA_START=534 /DNA_END=1299 /DNA_ORIENTATION=+